MTTVGIIAEYNPFHLGHKYQIEKIRQIYGADTAIIAVMSGNITQRGEVSIFDKKDRAKAAVVCGINLVLELPFPYSSSGAEFFAQAGVGILNALGIVDILAFGSECDDIGKLKKAANILSNEIILKKESHDSIGYAKKCEAVYKNNSEDADNFFTPNNILGIEYIKALDKTNSTIKPFSIKRLGDGYSDKTAKSAFASAMAIRELISKKDNSAFNYIPEDAKIVLESAIKEGFAPCFSSKLDTAVISFLRLNTSNGHETEIHDANGGLYNRIQAMSLYANSISSLVELAKTKKYTTARIRRAIWNSYFGVTSSDVKTAPSYTQILAMDLLGAALLKRIKKESTFPILTKPSTTSVLDSKAQSAKALSDKVDSVLQLTKPEFVRGDAGMLFTPFVKKE